MSLTIRMRLLGLAFLGPVAAIAVAAGGVHGLRLVSAGAESIALNGQVLRNHMQCDMDHDALWGDVIYALAAKDGKTREEALSALNEHADNFRDFLNKNKALAQDPKSIEAISRVEPDMRVYLELAKSTAELAGTDHAKAEAKFPEFKSAFENLERSMGELSELLEASAAESVEQGRAQSRDAFGSMAFIVGAASIVLGVVGVLSARTVSRRILALTNRMEAIASGEGELSQRLVQVSGDDEISRVARGFNRFVSRLSEVVQEATKVTQEVSTGSSTIRGSLDSQSSNINEQAMSVEQIAAAIEELSSSISEIAEGSKQASQAAGNAGTLARDGQDMVVKTISRLEGAEKLVSDGAACVAELGRRSEQINNIVTSIQEIADQTNLLALNAAIEAARAGEHGRGFAVVADEVRKLAERTTGATREVADAIKAIQNDTTQANDGMSKGAVEMAEVAKLAKSAKESLGRIVEGSLGTANMIQTIADSTSAQRAASDDISKRVVDIKQLADNTRGLSQASNQAASQLATRSESLAQILRAFSADKSGKLSDRRDQGDVRLAEPRIQCSLGELLEVSAKGANILSNTPPKVNSLVKVTFTSGTETMTRDARVFWVKPKGKSKTFGIRFAEALPEAFVA